jgi:hypothetical protein
MDIFQASATIGLRAFANPPGTLSANANQQGLAASQLSFPDANVAYSRRFKLAFDGETVDLNLPDGTYTEGFTFPEIEGVPEGVPSYIRVTGTLTDGSDPVTIPVLIFYGIVEGRPAYSETGDAPETNEWRLTWDGASWNLEDLNTGYWSSDSDVASPDLATWSPVAPSTGTPTVTGIGFSKSFDPSGKDLYGEDIPTITEIKGLLIECVSGETISRIGDEYAELTAGERRLSANAGGLESLLDNMEIEATAPNTEVRVTVIGKSA